MDGSGNLYIVSGNGGNEVLKETLTAGGYTQSVVANDLNNAYDVAADSSGNVYIADYGNNRVLKETLSANGYTESTVANYANNGLLDPLKGLPWTAAATFISRTSFNRVLKETLSAGGYTQSVVADAASNGLDYPAGDRGGRQRQRLYRRFLQ